MSVVSGKTDLSLSRVMLPASGLEQSKMADGGVFSLVSYNILADFHLLASDYPYCSPEQLDQKNRHRRLMEELRHLDADIVCLLEVGTVYFSQHLLPEMKSLGYEGEVVKRRDTEEGEATFYKTSRFELQDSTSFFLGTLISKALDDGQVEEGLRKVVDAYLDRPDIVLVSRFRCRQSGKVVNIGSTHLFWNEYLTPDVQAVQVASAIQALQDWAGGKGASIVMCGDFNSEPTMPPYQLACAGSLNEDSITQMRSLTNIQLADNEKTSLYEAVKSVKGLFDHSASLTSTYKTIVGREPVVTCLVLPVLDHESLDFILYNSDTLRCLSVLEEPSWPVLKASTPGLPNDFFPSDHIAQKAVFAFV